jgi:hypothetical protein
MVYLAVAIVQEILFSVVPNTTKIYFQFDLCRTLAGLAKSPSKTKQTEWNVITNELD